MSVLRPETREALRNVRPCRPLFSNQVLAELFEARHTIGPLKLLPRTCGGYVVYDSRRPMADRVLEVVQGDEDAAHAALVRWARKGDGQ
jgi:hypothetical protein